MENDDGDSWYIDDVEIKEYTGIDITGTDPSSDDFLQGSVNNILYKLQIDIASTDRTLTEITANISSITDNLNTLVGNYKLRYSTDATLDAGDATLLTLSSPATATSETISFTGLSQLLTSGSSYYLFVTCDVLSTAKIGEFLEIDENNVSVDFTGTPTIDSEDYQAANSHKIIANALSDIILNTSFAEPTNIPYASYQSADILNDANSIEVAQFTIQDGGGSADTDGSSTELTAITFSLSNSSNIRRVAIYDGATEIAEVAGGSTVTFSGISLTAADDASKTFSIRVSFNASVTDNENFQFAVTSATASTSGSTFALGTAGAAQSTVAGDENRIEVFADRLIFATQPPATGFTNTNLSTQPVINATDALGNIDLDYGSNVDITNSGGLGMNNATSLSITNGVLTFPSNFQFTQPGTVTITVAENPENSIIDAVSSEIIITIPASTVSVVQAIASSETATISSLENDATIATTSDGVQVWQIDIFDGDATADDEDNLPTIYTDFTFTQGGSNTVGNWDNAIQDLQFFEGATLIDGTVTVNATTIDFTPTTAISVSDGAASKKTISVRLSLKNPLPADSDNDIFQFKLTQANTTVESTTTSSQLSFSDIESSATDNKIEVLITQLLFATQPSDTQVTGTMSPDPTVIACDANGNIDVDYSTAISITSFGSLTGTPVSGTWSSGVATFSSLVHTVAEPNIRLTATSGGSGGYSVISDVFAITDPFSFCDDFEDNLNDRTVTNNADIEAVVSNEYNGGNTTTKACVFNILSSTDGNYISTIEKTFTNVQDIHMSFYYYYMYNAKGDIKIYLKKGTGAYTEVLNLSITSGEKETWLDYADLDLESYSSVADDYTIKIEGTSNKSNTYYNEVAIDELCVTAINPLDCNEPANQPTALDLDNNTTYNTIDGEYIASAGSPTANGYLIVRSLVSNWDWTAVPSIIDGTIYATDDILNDGSNDGVVVDMVEGTTFTATGLTESTTYYFYIFAYQNTSCENGPNYNLTSPLTGSETTTALPLITITGALSNFGGICAGGTSASQNYTVAGVDLTSDITITAPAGFEISLDDSDFSVNPLTLSPTTGTVSSTTIYVQFSPGSTGTFSDNITHTATAATDKNQAVAGTGNEIATLAATDAATAIGQTTATSGGDVTADGGSSVTAIGVCWNTGGSPTIANDKTTDGTGTGAFTSSITGLMASTTYYVRAYATNSCGTAYGAEISFTTTACTPTQTITSFVPTSGPVETIVTITGDGYTAGSTVDFYDGVSANIISQTATELIVEVPSGAETGVITVIESGCPLASGTDFTVILETGTCGPDYSTLFISELYDGAVKSIGYIELYNGTGSAIDLTNYSIYRSGTLTGSASKHYTFPSGTTINSGQLLIGRVSDDANVGGITPDFDFLNDAGTGTSAGFNDDDRLELWNATSQIDEVKASASGTGYSYWRKTDADAPKVVFDANDWTYADTESSSDMGTFTTTPKPIITTHPTDVEACEIDMLVVATGTTLTYQWKQNDGSATGWTDLTDGGIISGATTDNLIITGAGTDAYDGYQFYCEVTEDGACSSASNAAQFTMGGVEDYFRSKQTGVWNDAANWEVSADGSTSWTPACEYPNSANSNEVTILNGHTITIPDFTSSETFTADLFTIESGGVLEITPKGQFTVTNLVNNASTTGLILKSDATGTASLLQTTGAVEATVERYITGSVWHYMFAPLSSIASTTYSNEDGETNTNLYTYLETEEEYWDATHIYGTYGWTSMAGNLPITEGYIFNRYGLADKTFVQTGGNLDDADQSFNNITYTPHSSTIENGCVNDWTYYDGWNLVGNPYASAIDWENVDYNYTANTSGIEKGVYYYDGAAAKYKYYIPSSGTTSYPITDLNVNGGSQYIPAGQGFMVKAANSNVETTSFSILKTARVHNSQTFWKGSKDIVPNIIRLNVQKDDYSDEMIVRTLPEESGVTENHDGDYDAYKMFAWDKTKPQVYSKNDLSSNYYAVNSLPEFTGHKTVPLGVYVGTAGDYTINITENSFENKHVWLEDTEIGGDYINLRNNPIYEFTANAGTYNNRFILHFDKNNKPVAMGSILSTFTNEDELFNYNLQDKFEDIDLGDVLKYSITLADGSPIPEWLSLSNETLSGTPENDDVGIIFVKYIATDLCGATASLKFDITINNVNDAPFVVNQVANQTATEDVEYTLSLADKFDDIDLGDILEYSIALSDGSPTPDWLIFNNETITGTPQNEDVGIITLKYTATDLFGATEIMEFTLTVNNVNDAPYIVNQVANQTATEDVEYTLSLANIFDDVDIDDELTYSINNLPTWLSYNESNFELLGTPLNSDVENFTIEYSASDIAGSIAICSINFVVENVNDAPYIANQVANQIATEDVDYSLSLENIFGDIDLGDELSYSISLSNGDDLPQWLSYNGTSILISGMPENSDVGVISINYTATDLSNDVTICSFDLTVENVNDAPTLENPIENVLIYTDEVWSFIFANNVFNDIDFNDELTYTAKLSNENELPDWLSFNNFNRTFEGTPLEAQELDILLTATDLLEEQAQNSFIVTVQKSVDIINLESNISIFPNPTTGVITVKFANAIDGKLSIVNVIGQTMTETNINSNIIQLDLSKFAKGVYFINVDSDNQTYREKIILE